ncbi:sensor domain-containing diguanylate cyclase [Enterovibrio norvegicus]|uniref:sensor domain-containing diguanylate cyclase n=1 Tax=Enterovibrio norvegicus TaxID=188144 RepID=UPI0021598348|nr:sensor domain-containing diguanylate cyclase [Enterovibrio norvegicus]
MFQITNQPCQPYFDMAPVPMILLNDFGEIVHRNAECDLLFNIHPSRPVFNDYVAEDVWTALNAYFSELPSSIPNEPFSFDITLHQTKMRYRFKANVATTFPSPSYVVVLSPLSKNTVEPKRRALEQGKAFLEQLPVSMAMLDEYGIFVGANRAFCELLGYDEASLVDRMEADVTFAPDANSETPLRNNLKCHIDKQYSVDKRYIHKDGHQIWVRVFVSLTTDSECDSATDNVRYVIAVIDIHEEKQLQNVIATSERRFRAIAENISSVVWMSGADPQRVLYANKCYRSVWEESVDKLYSDARSFLDKVHPADREIAESIRFNTSGDSWSINYRLLFDDGRVKHLRDSGHCVFDSNGELIYRVGTSTDITAEISQRDNMVVMAKKLKELVDYDSLTGLKSRHAIMTDIQESFQRFKQTNDPSVLVYIDADGFKGINDTLGHDVGDKVLCAIAKHLTSHIRDTDVAGRIGGDEFIVLLRHTSQEDVVQILERLCSDIHDISLPGDMKVSLSLGAYDLSDEVITAEQWLNDADKTMYHNKRARKRARKSQLKTQ